MVILPFRHDSAFHLPVPKPRLEGELDVGEGHSIYWEEIGNPAGIPILILHGGPGGAVKPYYRRLIDPQDHRGILFDQRGCGRSKYDDPLCGNDIDALANDIEKLREARGIQRWVVVGGSWGSTLALHYSENFPQSVAGLVISGVFLARPCDIQWWWYGTRQIFPDVFDIRDEILSSAELADPRRAFRERILGEDEAAASQAALVLFQAEAQVLDASPAAPADDPYELDDEGLRSARIFCHFDANDFFVGNDRLLEEASKLAGIPASIIAGRADMCTPPAGAWDLHRSLPKSRLKIVANAGHRWCDENLGAFLVPEIGRIAREAIAS